MRSASRMAATLRQRYGKGSVMVVVSRSDRRAEIGHEDVERVVGGAMSHTFPSDYRRRSQALNKGRPVARQPQRAGRGVQGASRASWRVSSTRSGRTKRPAAVDRPARGRQS